MLCFFDGGTFSFWGAAHNYLKGREGGGGEKMENKRLYGNLLGTYMHSLTISNETFYRQAIRSKLAS